MDNKKEHSEIVNTIAGILRRNGFSLYHIEKNEWEPMINVQIVPNNEELFHVIIDNRWYFGSVSDKKICMDVIGCLHNGACFKHDCTIAIEVSCSSDIRKEVLKLKTVPSRWKMVVTKDVEGILDGMYMVCFYNFEQFLKSNILEPLRNK